MRFMPLNFLPEMTDEEEEDEELLRRRRRLLRDRLRLDPTSNLICGSFGGLCSLLERI